MEISFSVFNSVDLFFSGNEILHNFFVDCDIAYANYF